MIRAISYTILFCGMSAGAALGLAYVHDTQIGAKGPQVAHVAPQIARQPVTGMGQVAVSFAPVAERTGQAPRIAPVMQPTLEQSAAPVVTAPQTERAATPAPQTRRVAGMTTQGRSEFSPRSFDFSGTQDGLAPSVSLFEQARTEIPDNLRKTWNTGVYR